MFKRLLLIFISSRGLFFVFAYLVVNFIPLYEGYLGREHFPKESYLLWSWANFDGRHFLDIVVSGYRHFNFAFFPLYPLIIRILDNNLTFNILYIGIFVSSLCFLLSLVLINKIARLDYKPRIANFSLILLSFFPLSFFYHSMYADSLFLLLSTLSFYFARRGNWVLSGVFGALTTMTRLSGLALIPALFVEWVYQRSRGKHIVWKTVVYQFVKSKGLICLILTSLGFVSYLVYLQIFFGNWLLFQTSFSAWKQDEVVLLPQVLFRYIKIFITVDKSLFVYWIALMEFLAFLLYLGLAIYVWKKVRVSYGVFMTVLLLLVTFTGTLAGTPRYLLHLFPGFIGLSLLLDKKPNLKILVISIFIVFGFILTGLFTRGYFVA